MEPKSKYEEEYVEVEDLDREEERGVVSGFKRFILGPYWMVLIIILVAVSSFCLGKYYNVKSSKTPIRVLNTGEVVEEVVSKTDSAAVITAIPPTPAAVSSASDIFAVQVVGSKNGTKYHLKTCPGAKQISAKNLITFNSTEEARSAGYTPAANCKGLK